MKMNILLRKIHIEDKEFVTSAELKEYCKHMGLNYGTVVRYFAARGYFVRIFRGIFYVRSLEEVKLGRSKYSHLELVAKGLKIKNVKNWYFGMHSALKLNKMTHEYFSIEDVISDTVFRANPINISGYKFKFIKLSPALMGFGVKERENSIRYSDPEKTVLDFIYTWRYNGIPEEKIVMNISEWARHASKVKMCKYAKKYPKTVRRLLERLK